jgi:hypothetical protein
MLLTSRLVRAITLTSAAGLLAATPAAAQRVNGLTFSVAGNGSTGTAFATNGTGTALLGDFTVAGANGTNTRTMSEFNVAGLSTATRAILSFDVTAVTNPARTPTAFDFNLDSYLGNNSADIGDYSISRFMNWGVLDMIPLWVGFPRNFDVTSIFNAFLTNPGSAGTSLGFRISPVTAPNGTVYTTNNFRLVVETAQTTVPEPATVVLFATGLLSIGGLAVRRRHT